jgi:hypothetical protein
MPDTDDLQQLSIPALLLSQGGGTPSSSSIGPRRKLVPQLMTTGQWIRQCCLDDLTTQWLAAMVGEELSSADQDRNIQSMLIQAGDGNDLLVLIDNAEIPASVVNVQLVLTVEVAVGPAAASATASATTKAVICSSDPLWPHVALAQQEDPTCCIFSWAVRDSASAYRAAGGGATTTTTTTTPRGGGMNHRQKQTAFRLNYTRTDDGSLSLANIDFIDVPNGFWLV